MRIGLSCEALCVYTFASRPLTPYSLEMCPKRGLPRLATLFVAQALGVYLERRCGCMFWLPKDAAELQTRLENQAAVKGSGKIVALR